MPYIKPDQKPKLDAWIQSGVLGGIQFDDPGILNYIITQLLLESDPKRYADYNRLVGVLECCKLEFYRRAVAIYENKKIIENGDVYNANE